MTLAFQLQQWMCSNSIPTGTVRLQHDVSGANLPDQAANDVHAEPSPLGCQMLLGWFIVVQQMVMSRNS